MFNKKIKLLIENGRNIYFELEAMKFVLGEYEEKVIIECVI